jgi:sterol desaturase/sphingolipid hydroxylase (fatty acid hydroxylase superfamily)
VQLVAAILMPATFVAMLALERAYPGRPHPAVPGWFIKSLAWFAVACAGYIVVPACVAVRTPLHVPSDLLGALAAFAIADAIEHVAHRAVHQIAVLWRWTHQLHHSAERIEVAATTYRHPFDLALQLGALAIALYALGLSAGAGTLAAYLALAAHMFAHVNARTPQWIGWIIQRPEAHAVHHARGVHAYNYGTLTIWDLVLGTFRNPARFTPEPAGYWDGASREVCKMLVGRDVAEPKPANRSEGVRT